MVAMASKAGRRTLACARWGAVLLALALGACAGDPTRMQLGSTRSEVLQQLGQPTAIYALPGGERLQYSRAPAGFEVSNVDLDASGRVRSVRQELDESLFGSTIEPGRWRVEDVLRTYGPPLERARVWSFQGEVWTWRYRQMNARRFLYIYIAPDGVVQHYNVGDDPTSDSNRARD